MKESTGRKSYIALFTILIIIAAALIWYFIPTSFLKDIDASEIYSISVRDGNSGINFVIEDREDIAYIVGNIQERRFKKDGISLYRMGTAFDLSFCDEDGKILSEFIVNSYNVIRKDPFFYVSDDNMNINAYLQELEEKLST